MSITKQNIACEFSIKPLKGNAFGLTKKLLQYGTIKFDAPCCHTYCIDLIAGKLTPSAVPLVGVHEASYKKL